MFGKRESRFRNALLRIAEKLLNFLANDLRLISEIKQVQHKNKPSEIVVRQGLIKVVQYCSSGFFQEEKFLDPERLQEIRLRPELLELARTQLSNTTDHREKIFIHIRRGDYLSWPSPQAPAVLPDEWYFEAMSKMREKHSDPFFLFFSDDPDYVKEKFGHLPNTWISRNDAKTDLAMMAECQAGILSASSFAWWAAFFSRRNNKNGVYIAPKYWAGHRNKEWHPFIRTEWQEYLSVDSGPSQLEG